MIEALWILFAISCGLTEGFLLHGRPPVKTRPDKHVIFTIQRAVVGLICIYYIYPNTLHALSFFFFSILSFSLFHNGAYYEARKYLSGGNLYPRGWIDESTTTDAKHSFSFINRLWLFIIGCIPVVLYYIFKHQI